MQDILYTIYSILSGIWTCINYNFIAFLRHCKLLHDLRIE